MLLEAHPAMAAAKALTDSTSKVREESFMDENFWMEKIILFNPVQNSEGVKSTCACQPRSLALGKVFTYFRTKSARFLLFKHVEVALGDRAALRCQYCLTPRLNGLRCERCRSPIAIQVFFPTCSLTKKLCRSGVENGSDLMR
jgi:hypothetical protein